MVSGSRSISKCKATASSALRSVPREPLLFLYPRWTRAFASSATAPSSGDAGSVLRDAQSDFYQTYSQAESLGNSIIGHSPDVAPAPASESNGLNGHQSPSPSTSNDK